MFDMTERIVLGRDGDKGGTFLRPARAERSRTRCVRALVDRDVERLVQARIPMSPERAACRRRGAIDSTSATPRACRARASPASVTS